MKHFTFRMKPATTACAIALAALANLAVAQSTTQGTARLEPSTTTRATIGEARDAQQQLDQAVTVVRKMENEPGIRKLLQQARGVFIVPRYGRVALGVGIRGGEGVLLVKRAGKWSDPAFYNIGGVSAGVQAGAEAGALALILNNDKAVNNFMQTNKFSLSADAGLTIVNWSRTAQGSTDKSDVVAWSDAEGLFGGVAVNVDDINFDEKETIGYYGKQVAIRDIFNGTVKGPAYADSLKQALAGGATTGTSTGSSGSRSTGKAGTPSESTSGSKSGTTSGGSATDK